LGWQVTPDFFWHAVQVAGEFGSTQLADEPPLLEPEPELEPEYPELEPEEELPELEPDPELEEPEPEDEPPASSWVFTSPG
jgi:hypothetical protein